MAAPVTPDPKGIQRFLPTPGSGAKPPTAVKAAGAPPRSMKEEASKPAAFFSPASPVPSADGSDITSASSMGWASSDKLEAKMSKGAFKIFTRGKVSAGHYKDDVDPAHAGSDTLPPLSKRFYWVRRDTHGDVIENDEDPIGPIGSRGRCIHHPPLIPSPDALHNEGGR